VHRRACSLPSVRTGGEATAELSSRGLPSPPAGEGAGAEERCRGCEQCWVGSKGSAGVLSLAFYFFSRGSSRGTVGVSLS
jgi:hypothetical protein